MIKRADSEDANELASLAIKMWTEHGPGELTEEFRKPIGDEDAACFLKYEGHEPVAFAECRLLHDCVEGTKSSPVGIS